MTKIFLSPSSQEANIGPNGYVEEVCMNRIADFIVPELIRHGILVMRNNPQNNYLGHIKESNEFQADYHIAIHSNASAVNSTHTARGCVVFCYNANDTDRPGTQLANRIYNRLSILTPVPDRGVKSSTLDEVEKTKAAAVLIEVDFHDNIDGAAWLTEQVENIGLAILLGILEQLEIAYIPKPENTILYRIQIGSFRNYENALMFRDKIRSLGFNDAFIVKYQDR